MPKLPESIRPYVEPVVKYHFWILAGLVPLLLIPAVWAASGALDATINSKRSEIDGHISALRQISGEAQHPNEKWVKKVGERTDSVRSDLLGEWKSFWESQEPLRVWPADPLGEDFVAAVTATPPGKQPSLRRAMLERYQDRVRSLVKTLPVRMGCSEMMEGGEAGGVPGGPGQAMDRQPRRPTRSREAFGGGEGLEFREPLVWDAADQQRVYQSFDWVERPTTTQVLLAQEEIWVYGLFCDAIRSLNGGESDPTKAAISTVQELAVGYPAAEEKPGGQGTGRVLKKTVGLGTDPGLGEAGMEMGPGPMTEPGAEGEMGSQGRPPHPRFTGVGGGDERRGGSRMPMGPMGMEGEGAEAGPVVSPEEALQQWIYVDLNGKPLLASELATVPDAQLLHLMPFTLRVVMDQRKLDQLLTQLAANTVPIDVRQVRLNPTEGRHAGFEGGRGGARGGPGAAGPRGGGFERMTEGSMGSSEGQRAFDMTVELRGTVALAQPPRKQVIAGTPDAVGGTP